METNGCGMIELFIECVTEYNNDSGFGRVWLVEFSDWTDVIVLENDDEAEGNIVLTADDTTTRVI